MIALALGLVVLAAIAKAIMDLSSEGALPWNAAVWDKGKSWRRKWKNGDPELGERFPGSSTVFVFVTDGWHFSQFVFLNSLFGAFACFAPIGLVIGARVAFGLLFEVAYQKLDIANVIAKEGK